MEPEIKLTQEDARKAFKANFPGVEIRASRCADDEMVITFPNGNVMTITTERYELYPGSCDDTTQTRWTIDFNGGQICEEGSLDILPQI